MGELRETIDTKRDEKGWMDFPVNSQIILDDIEHILIKREGNEPYISYLLYYYDTLTHRDL